MQTATREQLLEALFHNQLPAQGSWDVAGYLWLTEYTNQLVEFTDGYVEVLPMPTVEHRYIRQLLFLAFHAAGGKDGLVIFAPLRLYLNDTRYREPDLLLLLDAADPRNQNRYWRGANLVLEVVSPDDPKRDLMVKRRDYALAEIPEYWIVNPLDETITMLELRDRFYVEHGVFRRAQRATSPLIPAIAIPVADVFNAR